MAASNCVSGGAAFRTAYAKELMEYIEVDSFGQCLHNKDPPKEMQFAVFSNFSSSLHNKIKLFADYKFVLTMENHNITDYVTEKLMNVFQAGTVPVYMGAPNVEPDWVPGEQSVIKIADFSGPKELAEFIKFLCNNDEEYYQYFEWKKKGFSEEFKEKMQNCVFYGAECRLCRYILDQRKKQDRKQKESMEKRKDQLQQSYFALKLASKQFVQIEVDSDFDVHDGFTLSAWVALSEKLDNPILSRGDVIKFGIKKIWKRGYAELCVLRECYYGSHPIILQSWTHVAVTYDWKHRIVKFYGNGWEDEAVSLPTVHIETDHYSLNPPLLLATTSQKRDFFIGRLDNVSFWNKPLDTERAKRLVYGMYDASEDGILAFWSFDQQPGTHSRIVDDVRGLAGEVHGSPKWEECFSKPLVTSSLCL